jgi:hypothetical protein
LCVLHDARRTFVLLIRSKCTDDIEPGCGIEKLATSAPRAISLAWQTASCETTRRVKL